MKKSSIKFLYRLFAFLSDKTNGFAPFVKYKLTLGAVLIGLGACSDSDKKMGIRNDSAVQPKISDSSIVEKNDSVNIGKKTWEKRRKGNTALVKNINPPTIEVTCYKTADSLVNVKENAGKEIKKDEIKSGHSIDPSMLVTCYKTIVSSDDVKTTITDSTIFTIVDQQPDFPGGDVARVEFIKKNLRYPKVDVDYYRAIVTFIVEKDGSISDINVARGITPELDKEAVRIVQLMPKWTPGKQRGKVVRVRYTIPINFRNEDIEH